MSIKIIRDQPLMGDDRIVAVIVRLTRYFGVSFRPMPDANGRIWLSICAWYPTWNRARKSRARLLGYRYGAIPWGRKPSLPTCNRDWSGT